MMNVNTNRNIIRFFGKAFYALRAEIVISTLLLLMVTLILSIAMYFSEHTINPSFDLIDGFVWTFVKYVQDPAEVVQKPITMMGKFFGTLVGIFSIAIFAVPVGFIGVGLTNAIKEKKREIELIKNHNLIWKLFKRFGNKALRQYLDRQVNGCPDEFSVLNIVPQRVSVTKIQIRLGLTLKDLFDTCKTFSDFRIKNIADAKSEEDITEDKYIVEHFHLNRKYGCFIPRNSNVTIICTGSFDELGIGWFSYYLAKMGGFNFISKEIEVDNSEPDSFYNLTQEPLYEKKTKSAYTKKNKYALKMLSQKFLYRQEFFNDLKEVSSKDGSWIIILAEHIKTSANQIDFHFTSSLKDGSNSTINEQSRYQQFVKIFSDIMKNAFNLQTDIDSSRYPLLKTNLGYYIRQFNSHCNVFVLRPSSDLINFNDNKLAIAYQMAQLFSEYLDKGHGVLKKDIEDLKSKGFGYKDYFEGVYSKNTK